LKLAMAVALPPWVKDTAGLDEMRLTLPLAPRLAATGALLLSLALAGAGRADDVAVPIGLQADLLFVIAGHDRNLPSRGDGQVLTLVLTKADAASARAAAQFKPAASAKTTVAGLPHQVQVMPFTSADALAATCREKKVSIVYLTPGFTAAEATAIGKALEGGNVLTVAAVPAMVKTGIVLGFDLVSGRAKLLIDLTQAAKQHVAFGPDVLGLMARTK
jgi:hypothetical protein